MSVKRVRYLALTAALGVFLAACGSSSSGGETASNTPSESQSPTAPSTEAGSETAGGNASQGKSGPFVLGVSNTLVGNGWREQMICAVKAQAVADGDVKEVIVANRNGGPTEQIADMQNLISQGVDAIIVNPSDREALNPVIDAAHQKGIVVVSVDQAVTDENAYVVTNDQVAVGRIGAKWLFDQMGGKGDVLYMRGIDGVPADSDRDQGFHETLKDYPDINIASEVFTGWDYSKAGQQALDVFGTRQVGGVWTSGTDYTVVNAMKTADHPYVPLVGQDTNEFVHQILTLYPDFKGAVVTNPAAIGGVGAAIALDALKGNNPDQTTTLTPKVLDYENNKAELEKLYQPDRDATYPVQVEVKPWTTYTPDQLYACKGPSEQ